MAAQPETPPGSNPAAPVDQVVDWDFAARTAARLVSPGPQVSADEALEIVAALRRAAATAHPHVQSVTGLSTEAGQGVLVVDRPGWARANAMAFRTLLEPVIAESFQKRGVAGTRFGPVNFGAIGSRVTGAEVGALLSVLASRVLGQYDAFAATGPHGQGGRLLLVAPTIVSIERELAVEPADFRLWVCLHEETHRVQFTANPWLAEHLQGEVRALVSELMLEPSQLADRLAATARSLPELLRPGHAADPDSPNSGMPLLDAIQSPEQRRRLAGVTAVMSLLEGHADVVMDEVGPQVVPTVQVIRQRFNRRRSGRGALDQLLRKLLGLDAKARQYADGAKFVRGVVERAGMDGFNAVWSSPETLPRPAEIADPQAWLRRVHG
ncbi:zinc-dependent metalloprotease [Spongisporangium articulatum]|uniref:Zinc-dependent metalloprotease n=1 Tax=Spongisporangium articulatum TaxID=3362603 RepID=A0ABW8ANF2_9ACTN